METARSFPHPPASLVSRTSVTTFEPSESAQELREELLRERELQAACQQRVAEAEAECKRILAGVDEEISARRTAFTEEQEAWKITTLREQKAREQRILEQEEACQLKLVAADAECKQMRQEALDQREQAASNAREREVACEHKLASVETSCTRMLAEVDAEIAARRVAFKKEQEAFVNAALCDQRAREQRLLEQEAACQHRLAAANVESKRTRDVGAGQLKDRVEHDLSAIRERVKLNIGGVKFETTLSTLTKHSGTYFDAVFRERSELPLDAEGCFFVDRGGTHFGRILNFLRTGKLRKPAKEADNEELMDEMRYYKLTPPRDVESPR
jgi:hypothetical protein